MASNSEEWTVLEQLIMVSFVAQAPSLSWQTISKQIRGHPLFDHSRDPILFTPKKCQQQFNLLAEKMAQSERRKSFLGSIPETATKLEEMLRRERSAQISHDMRKLESEIRDLHSEIRDIKAGRQDAAVTKWYLEEQKREREDILLTEQVLNNPREPTDKPPAGVDADFFARVERFLKKVSSAHASLYFRTPVKPDEAPGYYEAIKHPTDLATIRHKFLSGMIRNRQELWKEFDLLFENAFLFNEEKSAVYVTALSFKEHVLKELDSAFAEETSLSKASDGVSTRFGGKKK